MTAAPGKQVVKFLLVADGLPERWGSRRDPGPPSRPRGPRTLCRPSPRPAHSLLGWALHRGPGVPASHRLPALPRRGPRLPRRHLRAARARPRCGLGHGLPTHAAAAAPTGFTRSQRSEPQPSGAVAAAAAAALLPSGSKSSARHFRARHHGPPRGL